MQQPHSVTHRKFTCRIMIPLNSKVSSTYKSNICANYSKGPFILLGGCPLGGSNRCMTRSAARCAENRPSTVWNGQPRVSPGIRRGPPLWRQASARGPFRSFLCVWVSRGWGWGTRKPSAQHRASTELTTHSHLRQIRGRSGELRPDLRPRDWNRRSERRYQRSAMVPFSSSTSLAFGGSAACFSRSKDALYLCWGERFRYIPSSFFFF